MADVTTLREAAFLEFSAEFTREGLGSAPEGLIRLLKSYENKPGETYDKMRHRIYRRLLCIMWHGSDIGKKSWSGRSDKPLTYVYPECLKKVVRAIIPGNIVDTPDPTGVNLYKVKLADLASSKWPASKKK